MQSQITTKSHQNINPQIAILKFLRKAILPSILLCLFFLAIPNHIKAQIASIISEDGNGIVGITSLMNAAINDDDQAVKFFAKSGSAIINQKNVGGATALHIAARKGNIEICKILLENGANINLTDNEGWTPLMRAVLAKNADLVKMLISQGADPKKMNSAGETVIINSASSECSACLEQILSSYNFIDNFNIDLLKKQLEEAMIIANNKNDLESQSIIREYLNSQINKSRFYNLTNNQNPEISINPRSNQGDGIVMVRSLDDMNISGFGKSNSNKTTYKFLSKKIPSQQQSFSSSIPQKSLQNHHNIVNKLDEEINDSSLLYKTNSKKFIFKGTKKSFVPLNSKSQKSIQYIQPQILPEKTIIEPKTIKLNHNNLDQVTHINTFNNNSSNSTVKYKFLGKSKPFIAQKSL